MKSERRAFLSAESKAMNYYKPEVCSLISSFGMCKAVVQVSYLGESRSSSCHVIDDVTIISCCEFSYFPLGCFNFVYENFHFPFENWLSLFLLLSLSSSYEYLNKLVFRFFFFFRKVSFIFSLSSNRVKDRFSFLIEATAVIWGNLLRESWKVKRERCWPRCY